MAVRIKFDQEHNVIRPTLVLSTRSGIKLGAINVSGLMVSDNFNSAFEMTFDVYKYEDDEANRSIGEYDGKNVHWDEIVDFKLLWVREWDVWFEIYVSIDEDDDTIKHVKATSLGEAELSQIMLYDIEINTEDDIANDDYVPTVLYNEENSRGSLLDRILEKAPHYTIGHVDDRIASIQRTFSFSNKSIYDALQEIAEEIDCIFIIDSGSDDDGSIKREINAYDLEAYCPSCGYRDTFTDVCPKCGSEVLNGYGNDTSIFVSVENLADTISYETDTSSVKNCFKLEAGDDLMTATIINANPNGSAYIWYISDDVKTDMSDELVTRLEEYDSLYDYYNNEYELNISNDVIASYNELVNKYSEYDSNLNEVSSPIVGYTDLVNTYYDTIDMYLLLNDSLMPTVETSETSAEIQAALLNSNSLSPVSVESLSTLSATTASSAVLSMAKVIVDKNYQVKVNTSSLDGTTWTGNFKITNYSDDEDTAISQTTSITIDDNLETFVRQKIDKALSNSSNKEGTDISSLFAIDQPQFDTELTKWSLTSLKVFNDACQTCVDLLIEQGISNNKTWADKNPNMYEELYLPYYNKLLAIQSEIQVREGEIAIIVGKFDSDGTVMEDGMQSLLDQERDSIHEALNFQNYIGDYWLEFSAYRREDTYSNDNFISDGLSNKELFEAADEFIADASKEIYKSATLQHSISSTLSNLLVMEEFEPIVDNFEVGNWIRIKVDDEVFRLRLISYTIDFDNLSSLSITFSDVKQYKDGVTDSESIMAQARSMASSYGAVTRQSKKGKNGSDVLDNWVKDGLALTNMKIVNNVDNQNVTWDNHGILCREYLPITDNYSDKQIKIINKGLYVTDDNWRTSKAGIGNFTFYNPKTGEEEEAYGVIAETLVGNLILSEEVGIYNTTGSVVIDEDGINIVSDMTNEDSEPMTFSIGRSYIGEDEDGNEEEVLEQALYIDSDGKVVINGNVRIYNSENDVETVSSLFDNEDIYTFVNESIADSAENISGRATEYADKLASEINTILKNYQNKMSQYIYTSDEGLVVAGVNPSDLSISPFRTVIDNNGISFKSGNNTAAYIGNNQLYIPNATIETTLRFGNFFICPKSDDGMSIIWIGVSDDYNSTSTDTEEEEELVGNTESSNISYSGTATLSEMISIANTAESMKEE